MKKILYLHGLESKQGGIKVDYLSANNLVYAPSINYREEGCFAKLFEEIKGEHFDIVIGSSIGGFFAYELSKQKHFDRVIMFNPALGQLSINIKVTNLAKNKINDNKYELHLGETDDVVDMKETLMFLEHNNISARIFTYPYGHRTPLSTLEALVL